MTDKKRGLGRGLGALIPNSPGPRPAGSTVVADALLTPSSSPDLEVVRGQHDDSAPAHFAELPLEQISPNPRQPRQVFEEQSLAELVFSLKEIGLLQPVVVRPATDRAANGSPRFELVAGERRWRAAQQAGFSTIPAIIRETSDDVLLRDALLENLHRVQLNPLEEAAAYEQMLSDFGCTQEELATRIGRSRPQVSNTLRLLKLPPSVQRRVAAGVLSAGHARALLALDDSDDQERLAARIVAEGLSVRTVEELVALGDIGDEQNKPARTRTKRPQNPALADVAAALSDDLETRVTVDLGKSRGKITITFASVDDLERIVGQIAPKAAQALRGTR
ncbi:MAG TPA: ParB/RepB/Spo0J family partition protein [Actinomycetes bacterium]|nr:ParB/RepB/Spo0J family partition protein [Actinomycetes bacterium]